MKPQNEIELRDVSPDRPFPTKEDFIQAFIDELNQYKTDRERQDTQEKTRFFGAIKRGLRTFTYTCQEKLAAADKMIQALENKTIIFTADNVRALKDGDLGTIVASYRNLLPEAFTKKEKEIDDANKLTAEIYLQSSLMRR